MNYEPTKNNSHESEILSADERKLSALLGGLKRVEAPKGFDFKLKARIAAAPTDERKPFFFPALRYVLPLCLVVMLSVFAALKIGAPGGETNTPPVVAVDDFQPSNNIETASANGQEEKFIPVGEAAANFAANQSESLMVAAPKATGKARPTTAVGRMPVKTGDKSASKSKNGFGGDYERSTRLAPVINENLNAPGIKNPNAESSAKISVREMLKEIGIEVEFVDANWRITAVRENTPARIANMQIGDTIESIDNKKLTSDSVFLQSFTGKVFRLVRGGKQIVIDLTEK